MRRNSISIQVVSQLVEIVRAADWLRRFLVLKNGIPSQDTFLRIFRVLDPKQFESAFRRWVGGIVGALDGHVAIDGKTMCRSADGDAPPVHMVSAYSTGLGLVLGQEKVAGKSNELSALPELLEALHLKGLLVSIDAQGCQRDIAAKIIAKGGDYLLAVKGNQPRLHQLVRDIVTDAQNQVGGYENVQNSHGRTVLQLSWATPSGSDIDTDLWPACQTVGCVVSQRIVGDKVAELEQRYYISVERQPRIELRRHPDLRTSRGVCPSGKVRYLLTTTGPSHGQAQMGGSHDDHKLDWQGLLEPAHRAVAAGDGRDGSLSPSSHG